MSGSSLEEGSSYDTEVTSFLSELFKADPQLTSVFEESNSTTKGFILDILLSKSVPALSSPLSEYQSFPFIQIMPVLSPIPLIDPVFSIKTTTIMSTGPDGTPVARAATTAAKAANSARGAPVPFIPVVPPTNVLS